MSWTMDAPNERFALSADKGWKVLFEVEFSVADCTLMLLGDSWLATGIARDAAAFSEGALSSSVVVGDISDRLGFEVGGECVVPVVSCDKDTFAFAMDLVLTDL